LWTKGKALGRTCSRQVTQHLSSDADYDRNDAEQDEGRQETEDQRSDCGHARRMAELLAAGPRVAILNDVVLNQALVRFEAADDPNGSAGDARTRAVVDAVQRDGTCWLGGTTWAGRAAMRVSVSGWQTTSDDIERSAAAILRCLAAVDSAAG